MSAMSDNTKYPESVITKSRKGKTEVRRLLDCGKYARYDYLDPESGARAEEKEKLVLISGNMTEEYFIVPVKGGRRLMLPVESKGRRMVWDGEKAVEITPDE